MRSITLTLAVSLGCMPLIAAGTKDKERNADRLTDAVDGGDQVLKQPVQPARSRSSGHRLASPGPGPGFPSWCSWSSRSAAARPLRQPCWTDEIIART